MKRRDIRHTVKRGDNLALLAAEYYGDRTDDEIWDRIAEIGPRLTGIFEESRDSNRPTNEIADDQAKRIIASASS